MAVYTTRLLYDGHHTTTGILADGTRVASGAPVPVVRTSRLRVEAAGQFILTPVTPPPVVPVGTLVTEPVVVYKQGASDPVPMRIDRRTPLGYARYILHRVRSVLGIPNSYVDPYEDRF